MCRICLCGLIFFVNLLFLFSCTPNSSKPEIQKLQSSVEFDSINTKEPEIIIDSNMSFEDAIAGTDAPQEILDQLVLVDVEYYSTDDKLHRGQILLNRSIKEDIIAIFDTIKTIRFPVHQAIPIVAYGWDDNRSMLANNTSAFCYRKVAGTNNLSRHAKGKAIDINPFFNPLIWKTPNQNRPVIPEGAQHNKNVAGTLHEEHPIVKEFIKRKFTWGYNFPKYYDIHHFHKD